VFHSLVAQGLSVIPLQPGEKRPISTGWQKYNQELPQLELARFWDEHHTFPTKANIGLCLGPASGVMAVDIDTDDRRTHSIVPLSPFTRTGKPGREVRFYRYNLEIVSCKDHSRGIEVFANSGQVVLPPSIHPTTKEPYVWTGDFKFGDDEWRDMLPEMPNLKWLERCPVLAVTEGQKFIIGRNDALTKLVCAILTRGESIDFAVQEVLQFDNTEHHGREYFSDMSEPEARRANGNPEEAARIFCERHYRQLKQKGEIPEPSNITIDIEAIERAAKQIFVPLPKAPGLIGEIQEDILRCSVVRQPQLAMGGALALLSVCSLGRYSWNGQWPNLFVMNVGVSGHGKDAPQKYVIEALSHNLTDGENLVGLGGWQSSVAMIMDFPVQRFRIDVIDEFGAFIKDAAQGNAFKQAAMMLANELYSKKGQKFVGLKSAGRAKDTGACIGPGITVLASLQPDIFSIAANKEMFDNGFLRRFLYFIADQPRVYADDHSVMNADAVARKLKSIVMKRPALHSGVGIGGFNADRATWQPNCLQMETADNARQYLKQVVRELFEMDEKYHVRLTENTLRVSMLSAIACDRTTVQIEDIDFGVELTKALAYNGQRLLSEASSGTKFGKDQGRVIRWLTEKQRKSSTLQAFNRYFADMMPSYRRDVLKSLIDSGRVKLEKSVITLTE
jgi:hypothetical protein